MWGFSIEAELVENKDKQDELCCFVSRVEERSVASGNGNSRVFLVRQLIFNQLICLEKNKNQQLIVKQLTKTVRKIMDGLEKLG